MKLLIVLLKWRQRIVHFLFCILYLSLFFALNWRSGGITPTHALTLLLVGSVGIAVTYQVYGMLVLAHRQRRPIHALVYFLIGFLSLGVAGYILFIISQNRLSVEIIDHRVAQPAWAYIRFFMSWYAHLAKYALIFYCAETFLYKRLDQFLARYWPEHIVPFAPFRESNLLVPHFFNNLMHRVFDRLAADRRMEPMQVAHLSNLVKYGAVNHFASAGKMVALKAEIAAVQNMLSMEEEHDICMQVKGRIKGFKVPPMLLLSIAKNMIKHGDALSSKEPAFLELRVEDASLHVIGMNGVCRFSNWSRRNGGQGLQHMRQLLQTIYGKQAALHTDIVRDCFYLYLRIDRLHTYER